MNKINISMRNNSNEICVISLDNSIITKGLIFKGIKYNFEDDPMSYYLKIIKFFVQGSEMFFLHHRTDGINLTEKDWEQYKKEIPEFFKANGRYEPIIERVEKKGRVKTYKGYLTVGSLPINDKMYEILPKIFHYYFETTCFCPKPKIDWETFMQSCSNCMQHSIMDYPIKGYTDFLFDYSDSGIFSISFDSNSYDPQAISGEINRIIIE